MSMIFEFEYAALHLVDRQMADPVYASRRIERADFSPEDREVIDGFFSGHMEAIWKAEENNRTIAARFKEGAPMQTYYHKICTDPSSIFFPHSCDMAKDLHRAMQGLNAARGLLLVAWSHAAGDSNPYLVLMKMAYGPSHAVTLRQDQAGEILLELAVQHFERALPDNNDKVMKWAVIPHPSRAYDVKAKDFVAREEPARYFQDFLGCERRLSEKEQVERILQAVPAYARGHHPQDDWQSAAHQVLKRLEKEQKITPALVVSKFKQAQDEGLLHGFEEPALLQELSQRDAGDLCFGAERLRKARIRYRLKSGIIIEGPREVMQSQVEHIPLDGGTEFRIRTPEFEETYVWP